MIWAEALPRAAVQYITVSLTSELDSAPRYLHGRYITTMAATRADLSKSMWWQRDNIEQSDAFCPRVLSRWLQQLGHLKTLYVICKLGQLKDLNKQYAKTNCWVMDKTDRTSGRVTSGHKRSKKNATEMLLTVMQIFKGRSLYRFPQFLLI